MDRHQVRLALFKITALVLAATTWVFSSFIFATRPEESNADAITQLVRLPASLPSQLPEAFKSTTKALPPIEMDALAVPCWDKPDRATRDTSARWLRLTGKACQQTAGADHVKVRNLANGYVATVFNAGSGKLTTDYIPLQTGANEILVSISRVPGETSETRFTLTRE